MKQNHSDVLFQLLIHCKITWIIFFLSRGFLGSSDEQNTAHMVTLLAYSQWAGFGAFPLWQQELWNVLCDELKENKCIVKKGKFKILEIKMNFWNPHPEHGPLWKHSVRSCCRDLETNCAPPGYQGCPAALPSVSAQKLNSCCWPALPPSVLVSTVSVIVDCSQTKTERSCSQDKSNAKQNISTKELQLSLTQKKKSKKSITFTEP